MKKLLTLLTFLILLTLACRVGGPSRPQQPIFPASRATSTPTPTPAVVQFADLTFQLTLDFDSDEPSHCNRDTHHAEIQFTVQGAATGTLSGAGEGVLEVKELSRCPGTLYGGLRTTNNPFPVEVSGSVDGVGYHITLTAKDNSENYFTSGEVYASGSVFEEGIFPHAEGQDVSGTLKAFTLPLQLSAGQTFHFAIDTPHETGYWYVGTATLELLPAH